MSEERQFQRGIAEFNQELFFECHDTLEELWMETSGPDRLFLQGLIQVSVGFYHFFNRNFKGATSQLTKGLDKLDRYRPSHRGINIDSFTKEVVHVLATAERGLNGEHVILEQTKIPKIQVHQHQS